MNDEVKTPYPPPNDEPKKKVQLHVLDCISLDIEVALKEQLIALGVQIGNSKEVSIRVKQTNYPDGRVMWTVDDKKVLELSRKIIAKNIIGYSLERFDVKRTIMIGDQRIIIPSNGKIH